MSLRERLLVRLEGTGPRSRAYLIRTYGSQIEPVIDGLIESGVLVERGVKKGRQVYLKGRRNPKARS